MTLPGTAMNLVRSGFELLGYQLVVELSEHSIEIDLERPDKNKRAWDSSLYKSGNVFLDGYANPIKPTVKANDELENHDEATITEGEGELPEGEREDPDTSAAVIASSRFRTYMKQDLISQLLTPNEQWKLLAYAVGALGLVMLINVFISMSAAGMI
jgi:hypothetical protein